MLSHPLSICSPPRGALATSWLRGERQAEMEGPTGQREGVQRQGQGQQDLRQEHRALPRQLERQQEHQEKFMRQCPQRV